MQTSTEHLQQYPVRRLDEVATVRLGFTPVKDKRWSDTSARSSDTIAHAFSDFNRNTVLVIQPSNISDEGEIDWKRLDRINVPQHQSFEGHILWPGTVLLCLRGVMRVANLTAQTLAQDLDATGEQLPVVASGAWAVIRPDTNQLAAQYLCWYLKQRATTARLRSERAGSALQFIPLSVVQEMELPVPRRDTQEAVVRVAKLIDRLGRLEAERLELLRRYVTGAMQPLAASNPAARARKTNNRGNPAH
jgi:hypothetical protein